MNECAKLFDWNEKCDNDGGYGSHWRSRVALRVAMARTEER